MKGQTLSNVGFSHQQNSVSSLEQVPKTQPLEGKIQPSLNSRQGEALSASSRSKLGSELQINSSNPSLESFASNELNSLPDLVIIVGQEKELKAIKECQKLNIPTITILDSDGDPEKTSLFIPANDDSRSSVEFILKHLGQSILIGRLLYDKKKTRVTPLSKQKKKQKQTSDFSRKRNIPR